MRRVIIGTSQDGLSTIVSDGRPETALHVPPDGAPAVLTNGWTGAEVRDGAPVVHHLWTLDAVPTPPAVGDTASTAVPF